VSEFFELPPSPPPRPPVQRRQPEWFGPPGNVLGVVVPLDVTLVRAADVALAVRSASVYPTGLDFDVCLLLREQEGSPMDWHPFHRPRQGGQLPPEVLRLGVQFADGAKATNIDSPLFGLGSDERPAPPVLMPRGGGGGGHRWDVSFWLWPSPPPENLTLVCEWPARGIELTRVDLDVGALLVAAQRATPLWPDGGGEAGGAWTSAAFTRTD
jgi:hypothetical protein